MLEIMAFIENKQQELMNLPLFAFMQDRNIDPRQRLGFAPCMAHFIMSFSDLNKHVFWEKQPSSKIQQIINQHAYEDEEHWFWYLTDIEKLAFNPTINLTQGLRFVWGEETKITRQITYQIAGCSFDANPAIKLLIIEVLETIGYTFFTASAPIASELRAITKKDYLYFGDAHLCVESGHTIRAKEVENYLLEIKLTASQRQQAFDVVEKIFKLFSDWTYELLAYAHNHSREAVKSQIEPALGCV